MQMSADVLRMRMHMPGARRGELRIRSMVATACILIITLSDFTPTLSVSSMYVVCSDWHMGRSWQRYSRLQNHCREHNLIPPLTYYESAI